VGGGPPPRHHRRSLEAARHGVALWFEADDFDAAVQRCHAAGAHIETDVHLNPNAGHREIWLRDPDGYLVVLAEPSH
jgi:catechol 2,3-dioxygenase-like lactoylglutathione lyase family enzyme